MARLPTDLLVPLFAEHRSFLWGLCYRLTGCAADADDIVQETFIRVIEHPPARTDEPWRPWLVRVAINLGRDLLRRRRRRTYTGPWLPSPIETGEEASPFSNEITDGQNSPESRYDLLESVSFAFLLALEALTPQQRAVLLLRDVFDYSVQETAEVLTLSVANVKTIHHRARRAMQAYDRNRCIPTRNLQERTRQVLEKFLTCLSLQDFAGLEALLAADVRSVTDGGGEFLAALKPIIGRNKVLRFYRKVLEHNRPIARFDIQILNGLPALLIAFTDQSPRQAPRFVHQTIITLEGDIKDIYAILAPRKLTAVHFVSGGSYDDTNTEQ